MLVALAAPWLLLVALGAGPLFVAPEARVPRLLGKSHVEHLVLFLRAVSDWDRDGSSAWLAGGDCAGFDGDVHPNAREVPGNGLDDNCRYGDASPLPRTPEKAPPQALGAPPVNVLLITVDALRADHTSAYGYARDTTPELAALAGAGLRFERAYTAGGWTCLAMPALFSGVYARKLRFEPAAMLENNQLVKTPWQAHARAGDRFKLMVTVPVGERWTLQSALRARGMRTAAVYSRYVQFLAPFLGDGWEVARFPAGKPDADVAVMAAEQLQSFGDQAFFLWVHLYDPHDPQTQHPGVPEYGGELIDRYDHEVRAADRAIGAIVRAADALTARPTVVIVTSDHGEAFQWGFQFHGNDLYEDGRRVPLVLRAPGVAPRVIDSPASLLDIAPTVLALTGTPAPPGLDGRDLRTLSGDRAVVTDLWRLDEKGKRYLDQIAVTDARYHLTLDRLTQKTSLTRVGDLGRPPQELDVEDAPGLLLDALGAYVEYYAGGP